MEVSTKKFYEKVDLEKLIKGKNYLLLGEQAILFWHEKEQSYVVGKIDPKKRYTQADYEQLPENAPYQLINYQLIYMPSPFNKHQEVSFMLIIALGNYILKNHLGKLFHAPADVYFDEGNVYQPDLFFVSEQRKHIVTDKYTYGAPDLVIEILSESTMHQDYEEKMKVYGKHGVVEYWIVNVEKASIEVYHNENGVMHLAQKVEKGHSIHSKVIEGLAINTGEIF
jgi:Uma2 family endonuclease